MQHVEYIRYFLSLMENRFFYTWLVKRVFLSILSLSPTKHSRLIMVLVLKLLLIMVSVS